ncbi:hypothetical protein BSKO_04146 [Bryopsis sp. KO-2023]|nr:hypothetical protein BSKO_04146 [Bryopsis sp. KO-2023]
MWQDHLIPRLVGSLLILSGLIAPTNGAVLELDRGRMTSGEVGSVHAVDSSGRLAERRNPVTARHLLVPGAPRFANSGNSSARFEAFDSELNLRNSKTSQVDELRFPFTAIGQIASGCSAFLVGPCHVLTVAHCVYEPDYDFWWGGTEFHAGRNGQDNWAPNGSVPKSKALIPEKWRKWKDFDHDFAMLIMAKRIGDEVGWLDFGYDLDQDLAKVNVAGYPAFEGDPSWVNGTMYYDFCWAQFNYRNLENGVANHNCETMGGSSGSPLWVYDKINDRREVRALHSHASKFKSVDLPAAVKFRPDVYQTINKWKAENECPDA